MAVKNNDWTDELRDLIEGVELTPSEGGWDRLKADLHPRRAAWWPYAVPAAACLLIGGVFLFRGQPSENVLDVAASVPSAMVADVVAPAIIPEIQSLTAGEVSETVPPSATEEGGPLAVGSAKQTSSDTPPAAETMTGNGLNVEADMEDVEEGGSQTAEEPVPDGPAPVVEEEPALPSLAVQAPVFDFEEEPIARQRKQRRKITVTVSAGGAFGAAGNGIYFAQAAPAGPVTKAEAGRVMDITEVIQHSTPKQTALGLSIPISDRMDIGTGIDHLELCSVVGFGSQNLEWLGVPLRLGYRLADWGPSSISLGAGFKGEKCLSASLLGMDYTEPFQWAANMGADCRVRIFGPVSFSLTPELSYYFTDTVLPTYRTDHPLTFTLHAGLSINL